MKSVKRRLRVIKLGLKRAKRRFTDIVKDVITTPYFTLFDVSEKSLLGQVRTGSRLGTAGVKVVVFTLISRFSLFLTVLGFSQKRLPLRLPTERNIPGIQARLLREAKPLGQTLGRSKVFSTFRQALSELVTFLSNFLKTDENS